ncbi:MAG: GerAB/ArcD/ProY family transporter [Ethanoligenens sp.]
MTRLPFSTVYISGLQAGKSIQDILLAVPVNFLLNFIFAIPILVLLKRHPGKDLIECAKNIIGKPFSILVAIFYLLCFLYSATMIQSSFQVFFVNSVIPEIGYAAIAIPILLISFYGAVKGIESLMRFGGLVIAAYLIILVVLDASMIPSINLNFLFHQLYSGPQYFIKAVLNGVNTNIQIVFLAFCAPFLKLGTRIGKIFLKWNVIAMSLFLCLEFFIVTVLGPFGAKQITPLFTLPMQSQIIVFERLDMLDAVSWILNAILLTAFFIYLATTCFNKIGFRKRNRLTAFIVSAIIFASVYYLSSSRRFLDQITFSPYLTVVTIVAQIILPLIILMADVLKGRFTAYEGTS